MLYAPRASTTVRHQISVLASGAHALIGRGGSTINGMMQYGVDIVWPKKVRNGSPSINPPPPTSNPLTLNSPRSVKFTATPKIPPCQVKVRAPLSPPDIPALCGEKEETKTPVALSNFLDRAGGVDKSMTHPTLFFPCPGCRPAHTTALWDVDF